MTRRQILSSAAAFMLAGNARAADQAHALFWRATPRGGAGRVLFGYERIAAALVPDVVKDGDRFVDEAQAVVIDMGGNVQLTPGHLDRKQTRPILQLLSPATAQELRGILAQTPANSLINVLNGLEVMMLLMSDGGHQSNPSVGGTIAEHAKAVGRPFRQLLSDQEIKDAVQPPDMVRMNDAIGEPQVAYLLGLRRKVGPLGAYQEQLYRARQGEEIDRLTADIASHGIVMPAQSMRTDRVKAMLTERLLRLFTDDTATSLFVFMPLGELPGPGGVLAQLTSHGASVTPIA